MNDTNQQRFDEIVTFAKRKGFVYAGSEIYGGLANTWDFGDKGVKMLRNIRELWRQKMVLERPDMLELDASIFMNQRVWEASGHTASFSDILVDDKNTKHRFRADHLVEDQLGIDVEGKSSEEITTLIRANNLLNPLTKKPGDWTDARAMNLMFETNRDKVGHDPAQTIHLRPETAQAIFVDFKNIVQTERPKLPFGVAQIGKAFRNEITPGNFLFRVVEFEQMEIEYFIREEDWEEKFEEWLAAEKAFLCDTLGIKPENIYQKEHAKEKLSHYSKRTVDLEYRYPFGCKELWGLAYRTNFDLNAHKTHSGQNLDYINDDGTKYIPHVIEPSVGLGRLFLALLCDAYTQEEVTPGDIRTVLKLVPAVAPFRVAVLPLMKKDGLAEKAKDLWLALKKQGISADYDEAGSIGKRYRRQDENGTPWCITLDYTTLDDGTVTIRNRDTMEQQRISMTDIAEFVQKTGL
jgi:glycyl-tRNA synthetase